MKKIQKCTAYIQRTDVPLRQVTSSKDAWSTFMEFWNARSLYTYESMYMLHLNRNNDVIGVTEVSKGGMTATIADGKIIFRNALMTGATAIIIAHNHPSGVMKPSNSDIQLTKKLREFGDMIDLKVFDHLIISGVDKYYSMEDEGDI